MHDGEAAFAAYPLAGPRQDAGIVEDGGLVEQDASAVDGPRKRHLVGVEVVKCRLAPDLVGLVPQDVEDRVGGEEDVGIGSEVWAEERKRTQSQPAAQDTRSDRWLLRDLLWMVINVWSRGSMRG